MMNQPIAHSPVARARRPLLVLAGAAAAALASFAPSWGATPPSCAAVVPIRNWIAPASLGERPVVGDLQLAVSANGDAIVVWLESDVPGHFAVMALRYVAGLPAGKWEARPTLLGDFTMPADLQPDILVFEPRVAMNSLGDATAVWTEAVDSMTTRIRARHLRGGGWGNLLYADTPPALKGVDSFAGAARVVLDDKDRGIVSWGLHRGGQPIDTLQAARFTASGFQMPARVSASSSRVDALASDLVVNAAGQVMALWAQPDNRTLGVNGYDPAAGWSVASTESGPLVPPTPAGVAPSWTAPIVSHDANGRAFAGWKSYPSAGASGLAVPETIELQPARYAVNPPWPAAPLLNAGAAVVGMAAGADAAGDMVMVWGNAAGSAYPGVSARVRTSAGVQFPDANLAPSRIDTGDSAPGTVSVGLGGDGNGIAVWLQHDGTAPSVYANHLQHSPPQCPDDWTWGKPRLLESHVVEAQGPVVRVYPNGTAFVLWQEPRAAGDPVRRIWVAAYR